MLHRIASYIVTVWDAYTYTHTNHSKIRLWTSVQRLMWVKHQTGHCDSSVLHTTMQIISQFWTKFNLNGDKIGCNANQTRFSMVLECYRMWNDEGVVQYRHTSTCVRVMNARINDKVISIWMIQKHSSFYEPSPASQWQILSLATGPSKISSTAINAHSSHSINHLDIAHCTSSKWF